MSARRGDAIRVADILRAASRIEEVLAAGYEAFSRSWLSQSAVIRELEVIGEAAGAASASLRKDHPEVEWTRMRGFASFAKHEYWRVDPSRVWKAVTEMPSLRGKIGRVLIDPD
ncbi:MAG: HepT-like ribonuclease domain-containing protein [Thermoplasmata archaeon]